MKFIIFVVALAAISIVSANDPRVANAIPYLAPDPSLKTTDGLYAGQCDYQGGPGYVLPSIFAEPAFSNHTNESEHDKKMNTTEQKIVALSSYYLTEDQMTKGNISLGSESWL